MMHEMTTAIGRERQAHFLTRAEASRLAKQARGTREPSRPGLGTLLSRAHGLVTPHRTTGECAA